jgi:hypothetical protein
MEAYHANSASTIIAVAIWFGIMTLLSTGAAIGNGFLAARLNKSVALWVILSLIPIYNLFFLYYVGYVVVSRVLGRLNAILERVDAIPS